MARVPLAVLAVGLLLVAACGGEDIPVALQAGPASVLQLTGPWQQRPFVLDPALRGSIEQACRSDMERGPGSVAAIVDVRGKAVAVVRMTGQGAGTCDSLEITPGGQVNGAGSGEMAGGLEQLLPIEATEIADARIGTVGGGSLTVQGWSVIGRAGSDIASVEIAPVGGPRFLLRSRTAGSPGGGPQTCRRPTLEIQTTAPDVVVRGYDAAGTMLAEVRP